MDSEIDELRARLAAVERSARRSRILLWVAIAAAAAGAVRPWSAGAANAPEVIKARGLVIVDDRGTRRVALLPTNTVTDLSLFDEGGKLRSELVENRSQTKLVFFDAAGNDRVFLSADQQRAGIALSDTSHRLRARMVEGDDASGLNLYDPAGNPGAVLTAGGEGRGLAIYDKRQDIRAVLGSYRLKSPKSSAVERRPESSLLLFDEGGAVLWKTP